MSARALRWQTIGGYLVTAFGVITWPVVKQVISSGGHPMVVIGVWIILLMLMGYLLFMRSK